MFYNLNTEDKYSKTFILVSIANKEIAVFVDIGEMTSIIDYKVLKALNMYILKLESKRYIRPVGGLKISLEHHINIDLILNIDFLVPENFLVVKNCAVSVLISIDVAQNNSENNLSGSELMFVIQSRLQLEYDLPLKNNLYLRVSDKYFFAGIRDTIFISLNNSPKHGYNLYEIKLESEKKKLVHVSHLKRYFSIFEINPSPESGRIPMCSTSTLANSNK
ncbi:hypothetical protein BB561_001813 [Smittium simulii]|uniref:Aspartic peptidase DDI1-type domain-containing protein n=1 Tax=Smittium simulii TaxID=133385 RepID=A0A2T9YSY8_9FUNG|nr:hypothetical protein BB561_001813 [Smittium simulii]